MDIYALIAEQRIREAIGNGEFDDLEGFGKPIDNTEYFSVPAEERVSCHILKNAGAVPHEVILNKKAVELSKEISKANNNIEVNRLKLELSYLMTQINFLSENRRQRL